MNQERYDEIESKLQVLADKIEKKKDNFSELEKLLDEFIMLSEEQDKIQPYSFVKKKKIQAVKTMRKVVFDINDLKIRNRIIYERKKNQVRVMLSNLSKKWRK
jgi:hypothetical protein